MVPAMVTVDPTSEIHYNKASVISQSTPTKAVEGSYIENTSGLVMATAKDASKLKTN